MLVRFVSGAPTHVCIVAEVKIRVVYFEATIVRNSFAESRSAREISLWGTHTRLYRGTAAHLWRVGGARSIPTTSAWGNSLAMSIALTIFDIGDGNRQTRGLEHSIE